VLPANCRAVIRNGSWDVLPIFKLLQEGGGINDEEMFRVFNMGIGMVLIVAPELVGTVQKTAEKAGVKSYLIGAVDAGKGEVDIV
jgi:phosphoribosylformylglycinamidine cyclo-ligase